VEPLTLSRDVLDWASQRAGMTLEAFAKAIAKRETDQDRIVGGRLTASQAAKLAKKAKVPFGYLFLQTPPELVRPSIPDLRQVQGAVPLSDDFYEVLEDVLGKQEWYADFLNEHGAQPLDFVGRFQRATLRDVPKIVSDIRTTIQGTDRDRSGSTDADDYFRRLSTKIEAQGVLVIKTSFVKSATRRGLSEKEFRGFALAHPTAPFVFVNGRDAETAAVFTLLHELAHIWLGASGVSDVAITPTHGAERICNAVAGEYLVPAVDFRDKWSGPADLERLSRFYRVSRLVIARRALDMSFVDQAFYDEIARTSKVSKRTGAPSGLVTIPGRNSKRFTKTVVSEAMSGNTLLRDAAALLNVRPDTIVSLAKERKKNA